MNTHNIGKIQEIELKDCWRNEAYDFTPWLAENENIEQLAKAIGMEQLTVQDTEFHIGQYRADIVCKDMEGNSVLIENQLEETDHKHLGQLMTYAAGLEAVSIIWIAKTFSDQHRAALDWLNHITCDGVDFYGVEIHLIKIEDSKMAPLFKVEVKPNELTKRVNHQNLSETREAQLDYWLGYKEYLSAHHSTFVLQNTKPQPNANVVLGKSNIYLATRVNCKGAEGSSFNTVGVCMYINKPDKGCFDFLKEKYEEASKAEISSNIIWDRHDNMKYCEVVLSSPYEFTDDTTRDEQYAWLKDATEKFVAFFKPKVKDLK